MKDMILSQAAQLQSWLEEVRRDLHQHPETGFDLTYTKETVKRELIAMGYEPKDCGKAGVVALALPQGTVILAVGGGGVKAIVPVWAVHLQGGTLQEAIGKPVFCGSAIFPQGKGGSQVISCPYVVAFFCCSFSLPVAIRKGAIVQGGAVNQSLERKEVVVVFLR